LIYQLGRALINEAEEAGSSGTQLLYYGLVLMEWVIYKGRNGSGSNINDEKNASIAAKLKSNATIELGATIKGGGKSNFTPDVTLRLAQAHYDMWSRKGVSTDIYHLYRARDLLDDCLNTTPSLRTAATTFLFCKVLHLLGDMRAASVEILRILAEYEHDSDYANYLFFAGGVFKALGMHDKANNYFFDASQVGPPRLFSKLEMMIIISRTIEEQTVDDDVEEEDAYKMVHAHMILEGLIDEGLDYDDWISHSGTWLALGDKCAMHHMYALAADLYALGMMKDPDAYHKPMLWLRFAKACKRCGRISDGLLAVKVGWL
jgi:hypothetical protein